LTLFDEILGKGFDGHHFINGLGEHFRNLLVCRDKVTIPLMEVSEDTAEKYGEQSGRADLRLLIKGLDFLNQCDLQYKQSKNPRLLVELTLMQLCSIPENQKEGEKKKFRLKGFRVDPGTRPAPTGGTREIRKPDPAPAAPPVSTDAVAAPAAGSTTRQARSMAGKIFSGPSLQQLISKPVAGDPGRPMEESGALVLETEPFTAESFEQAWLEFAETVKDRSQSLYTTLVRETKSVDDNGCITLLLSNSVQSIDIETIRSPMLDFLKRKLRNGNLTLTHRLMDPTEQKLAGKSPKEKYEELVKLNPALELMRKKFKLEIDF
ncbi:MAG: hypothetical protein JNM00_09220, partial [Flavobacteriales bacterium]|nr:hypothetical protein [Flavobacteriales bacterium]